MFLDALRQRQGEAPEAEQAGLDVLIGYSLGQRRAAQAALEGVEVNQPRPYDRFMDETIEAVRQPHEGKELIELARPLLRKALEDVRLASAGNLKDYEHLHQVRIAGKRLRYAMEVFAECFAPAFRAAEYPQIEEMQETLGRANDSHVAIGRLTAVREGLAAYPETWGRAAAGVEELMKFHQRRLPLERRKFVKWWQAWQGRELERMLQDGSGQA